MTKKYMTRQCFAPTERKVLQTAAHALAFVWLAAECYAGTNAVAPARNLLVSNESFETRGGQDDMYGTVIGWQLT